MSLLEPEPRKCLNLITFNTATTEYQNLDSFVICRNVQIKYPKEKQQWGHDDDLVIHNFI